MSEQNTRTARPVATLRDGALCASIWRNESSENVTFFTCDISRTYTDANGNYGNSNSLSAEQLLRASHLSLKAYDRTRGLQQAERDNARQSERQQQTNPQEQTPQAEAA